MLERRSFFFSLNTLIAAAALVAPCAAPARAADDLPHIVFILADDMGWGDPQCNRAESKIPTPHMDRLAAEGMRFTDAHTPSAVCTPTRYALLTGRFAWRTRLKRGVLGPYSAPLIESDRLTLPSMLRAKGYATACVGKWHLGMQWATKKPGVKLPPLWDRKFDQSQIDLGGRITAGPLTAGFDEYFGTAVPNFPPYCFIENDRILGAIPVRPKPNDVYGNPGLMQEGWKLEEILPGLEKRAVATIERRVREDPKRPFFLYMPLTAPHTPIVPAAKYLGKSAAGDYGDLVHQVDAVVGSVVATLERLAIADRTLVIVTSDNGSPARAGDPHIRSNKHHATNAVLRMYGHNPNAPWRGMKADIFEGGHRVPMIVRWPGRVKAGSVNRQTVCLVDTIATVAQVIGCELPDDAAEDSFSLLPTWRDPTKAVRSDLVHHSGNGAFAVRAGDWKLIAGHGSGGWTRVPKKKGDPPGQLYNLAADPGETKNLYRDKPEVVARLQKVLERYRSVGRSRPPVSAR